MKTKVEAGVEVKSSLPLNGGERVDDEFLSIFVPTLVGLITAFECNAAVSRRRG